MQLPEQRGICLKARRDPSNAVIRQTRLSAFASKPCFEVCMNKFDIILIPLLPALLLTGCATIGLKETRQSYGAKFTGTHPVLAKCVLNELRSDSRWLIRGLQYDVRTYRDIEATEIFAYPHGALPGTYARNSPDNPDAVLSYTAPGPTVYPSSRNADTARDANPSYSFVLMLKRTDSTTIFANMNGKKYESDAAWHALNVCATR
jgi:hypothetical protein